MFRSLCPLAKLETIVSSVANSATDKQIFQDWNVCKSFSLGVEKGSYNSKGID